MHSLVVHNRRWKRLTEKYRYYGPPVNIHFWAIFERSQKKSHWSTPESRPSTPTLADGLCDDQKLYNRFRNYIAETISYFNVIITNQITDYLTGVRDDCNI